MRGSHLSSFFSRRFFDLGDDVVEAIPHLCLIDPLADLLLCSHGCAAVLRIRCGHRMRETSHELVGKNAEFDMALGCAVVVAGSEEGPYLMATCLPLSRLMLTPFDRKLGIKLAMEVGMLQHADRLILLL